MKRPYLTSESAGLLAGIFAFFSWGILPLFWKLLEGVPAFEIICYRIICSLIFVVPVLLLTGRKNEVLAVLHERKTAFTLLLSSIIIGMNWFLYIWAVNNDRVLETSLGYYINPLMNIALGMVFLHERATRLQTVAIILACIGVGWSVLHYGYFPWLSFALAITFALYGFIRKEVHVEALPGLFWETVYLLPIAVIWLAWEAKGGKGFLVNPDFVTGILLLLAGPFTSIPMALFAFAARHIKLMTVGLLQYISPTMTFFTGVFLLHETMREGAMLTFCFIWVALILYTWEEIRLARLRSAHVRQK